MFDDDDEQPVDDRRRILKELSDIKRAINDLNRTTKEGAELVERSIQSASASAAQRDAERFFRHLMMLIIAIAIIGWRWWTGAWPLTF